MLGKSGVSGVFIGREGASPGSDGGSKSKIRGYGGSKNMNAYPSLNVGYPRVKGRKGCPFDQSGSGGKRNMAQEHRMLQALERTRSTTGPRKVGDCSLATFRTSAIFENDRVTAEVPSQC